MLSVYEYGDSDAFYFGYVIDHNSENITFQNYNKFGRFNGIFVMPISSIHQVSFDDDYAKAMQHVISHAYELEMEVESSIRPNFEEEWKADFLKQLAKAAVVTKLDLGAEGMFGGIVLDVSEEDFSFRTILAEGEDEGICINKIEDLVGFRFNDQDCRRRMLLYRWRSSMNK